MGLTAEDQLALDGVNTRYSAALDRKNMLAWLACFADSEEASYICLTKEGVDSGLELALMMDDCRARLLDRVTYITQIWAGTFQDYGTRHFVQRVEAERRDDGNIAMFSNFLISYTPEDSGSSEILTSGVYEDIVTSMSSGPKLLSRRAVLDSAVLPRYLVYPL